MHPVNLVNSNHLKTIYLPNKAIQVCLSSARQRYQATCGAIALKCLLKYWKIKNIPTELELVKYLGITKNKGVSPTKISCLARQYGLKSKVINYTKWELIEEKLKNKNPVICSIQAWTDDFESLYFGHYVILVGLHKNLVIFKDPLMTKFLGAMDINKFESRWIDMDYYGKIYRKVSIVIEGKEFANNECFKYIKEIT